MDEKPPRLLTVEELAAVLTVPKSWVYEQSRQRKRNGFPCEKYGKYLRFDLNEVRVWARKQDD